MFSSTSSFRTELKVVGLVLLFLLACDTIIRWRENSLSLDLKHINQIPDVAKDLTDTKKTKVLFLGNSLTRNGVDVAVLDHEFENDGVTPPHFVRAYPDSSIVKDWYYVLKHYFVDTNHLPDVLIVSFATTHLQDSQQINLAQLARYFSGARDIPEIFSRDVTDTESRAEFLLADISAAYASRNRVRLRILDAVIPYFRSSEQRVNATLQTAGQLAGQSNPTYEHLWRLIDLAKSHNVEIIFVAMPQREPYTLKPELARVIESRGGHFIDARAVDELRPEHYVDYAHLNPRGAEVYSRFLAKTLVNYFRPTPASSVSQSPSEKTDHNE